MAIYFPVLRWKLGERKALANLDPAVKDHITPIIEFPLDCGYDDRKITDFCTTAIHDWGVNRLFYLDLSCVDYDDAPTGINHPALGLLRTAHQHQLVPIPIFNVNMDPDLFGAIQQAYVAGFFRNMALRITDNEEDTAAADALEMMRELGIRNADVDLIIDLCNVSNVAIRAKIRGLQTLIAVFVK